MTNYEEMKTYDLWTIDEGIKLLHKPNEVFLNNYYRISWKEYLLPFIRAFEAKTIHLIPSDDYNEPYSKMDLEYCLWDFKIRPLEFLMFVKQRGLFKIPPELEWVERKTESGKIKYYWADNIPEEDLQQFTDPASNIAKSESAEDDALTGKERQELGRLRAEKATMDLTVEAAVEVGQFIHKKVISKELVVRKNIEDFIFKINKNIPKTRIDLIWKKIPKEIKSGPGRPTQMPNAKQ